MEKYHVSLTGDEQMALAKIDLHNMGDHVTYLANKQPILTLVALLNARKAIPEHRLRYWSDPEYHAGRVKDSHRGLFERNGTRGDEIFVHPHFLPYLRYFLYGPDLPDRAIEMFAEQLGNPEWFTSGDIDPLCKCARSLVRQLHLDKNNAAEEFFKLCLEIGLDPLYAQSVRKSVRDLR